MSNRRYAWAVARYYDGDTTFEGFHAVFLKADSASREAGELNKDVIAENQWTEEDLTTLSDEDEDQLYHVFPVCLIED